LRTHFGDITRESDTCVICGEREATTREHIPPQALFIEKPLEYLVVPCCEVCNNSTKLDDDYLRQTMSATALVGQGRNVWKNKVVPKFRNFPKTQAGLREKTSIRKIEVEEFGKLTFPVLMIDSERFNRSIHKMVYGLYWFHTSQILVADANLAVNLIDAVHGPKFFQNPEVSALTNKTEMGVYQDPEVMKTFFYTSLIYNDTSIWFFFFYKQSAAVAMTKLND
jgi:hypothetical protein